MVLIAYGLPSVKAAGLRLDDLNWEEETLRVRCPSPGRTHHYLSLPFIPSIAETLEFCIATGYPFRHA